MNRPRAAPDEPHARDDDGEPHRDEADDDEMLAPRAALRAAVRDEEDARVERGEERAHDEERGAEGDIDPWLHAEHGEGLLEKGCGEPSGEWASTDPRSRLLQTQRRLLSQPPCSRRSTPLPPWPP